MAMRTIAILIEYRVGVPSHTKWMGLQRTTTARPPWPPLCGAPPRRRWPASVGCALAAQPVHSVAWATPAAIAEVDGSDNQQAKPPGLLMRLHC